MICTTARFSFQTGLFNILTKKKNTLKPFCLPVYVHFETVPEMYAYWLN